MREGLEKLRIKFAWPYVATIANDEAPSKQYYFFYSSIFYFLFLLLLGGGGGTAMAGADFLILIAMLRQHKIITSLKCPLLGGSTVLSYIGTYACT